MAQLAASSIRHHLSLRIRFHWIYQADQCRAERIEQVPIGVRRIIRSSVYGLSVNMVSGTANTFGIRHIDPRHPSRWQVEQRCQQA